VLEITVFFQPISTFSQPKSILVGQFYYTFSIRWQSITYKMSYLQKNGLPISDPYFYHCNISLQARAYGSQDGKLTEEMMDVCMDEMTQQHQQKQAWNDQKKKRTQSSNNL